MSAEAARRWNQQISRKRRGETSDAEAAFKKIRSSAESRLPTAKTRQMIVAYFQDNDDLSMPTYRVSLLCPLSKARISVAARGVDCAHIQCFDLERYLKFQVQNSLWACPIAGRSKQLRLAQLRVDEYFRDAFDALRNRPEVTYLDLLPNGGFVAVKPRTVPVCEDVPDDESPYVPSPVEHKREPLDVSDAFGTSGLNLTAATASNPTEAADVDLSVMAHEETLQSRTSSRRQRKSNKRRGPSKKELLDALARKDAESSRREEELQSAYAEILRLRGELAGKERKEGTLRQTLSEANAAGARFSRSLEEAHRCPCDETPDKCTPCEIRSLQEHIGAVQHGSWALTWEIAQIETIKSDIRSLEEIVDATKHEELAMLHVRLKCSEHQEQQLREKLQKAKSLAPSVY